MDQLLKWWPAIGTGLNAIMVWIAWSFRQFAKDEVERIVAAAVVNLQRADLKTDETVDHLDTRITKIESAVHGLGEDIAKLPTKADLARLEGEIKAVGVQTASTNEGIKRLEGYWLAKGVEGV